MNDPITVAARRIACLASNGRGISVEEAEEYIRGEIKSSLTALEWQAILDALAFTAQECPVVSDAHNRAAHRVMHILGKS